MPSLAPWLFLNLVAMGVSHVLFHILKICFCCCSSCLCLCPVNFVFNQASKTHTISLLSFLAVTDSEWYCMGCLSLSEKQLPKKSGIQSIRLMLTMRKTATKTWENTERIWIRMHCTNIWAHLKCHHIKYLNALLFASSVIMGTWLHRKSFYLWKCLDHNNLPGLQ